MIKIVSLKKKKVIDSQSCARLLLHSCFKVQVSLYAQASAMEPEVTMMKMKGFDMDL